MIAYGCLSFSFWLHLVWWSLSPSMLLQWHHCILFYNWAALHGWTHSYSASWESQWLRTQEHPHVAPLLSPAQPLPPAQANKGNPSSTCSEEWAQFEVQGARHAPIVSRLDVSNLDLKTDNLRMMICISTKYTLHKSMWKIHQITDSLGAFRVGFNVEKSDSYGISFRMLA